MFVGVAKPVAVAHDPAPRAVFSAVYKASSVVVVPVIE